MELYMFWSPVLRKLFKQKLLLVANSVPCLQFVLWWASGLSCQRAVFSLLPKVALKLHFERTDVLSAVENQALGVQIGHSISSSFDNFGFVLCGSALHS